MSKKLNPPSYLLPFVGVAVVIAGMAGAFLLGQGSFDDRSDAAGGKQVRTSACANKIKRKECGSCQPIAGKKGYSVCTPYVAKTTQTTSKSGSGGAIKPCSSYGISSYNVNLRCNLSLDKDGNTINYGSVLTGPTIQCYSEEDTFKNAKGETSTYKDKEGKDVPYIKYTGKRTCCQYGDFENNNNGQFTCPQPKGDQLNGCSAGGKIYVDGEICSNCAWTTDANGNRVITNMICHLVYDDKGEKIIKREWNILDP